MVYFVSRPARRARSAAHRSHDWTWPRGGLDSRRRDDLRQENAGPSSSCLLGFGRRDARDTDTASTARTLRCLDDIRKLDGVGDAVAEVSLAWRLLMRRRPKEMGLRV